HLQAAAGDDGDASRPCLLAAAAREREDGHDDCGCCGELLHSWGEGGAPGFPFGNISAKRRATAGGPSSSAVAPQDATSFAPLDEDAVKVVGGPPDHVEVAQGDRVVAARADRGAEVARAHGCSKTVRRTEPYRRLVRSASGSSGCSAAGDSTRTRPPSASSAGR